MRKLFISLFCFSFLGFPIMANDGTDGNPQELPLSVTDVPVMVIRDPYLIVISPSSVTPFKENMFEVAIDFNKVSSKMWIGVDYSQAYFAFVEWSPSPIVSVVVESIYGGKRYQFTDGDFHQMVIPFTWSHANSVWEIEILLANGNTWRYKFQVMPLLPGDIVF